MKTVTTHTNKNGINYYSTKNDEGKLIYSFNESFEDYWTEEDQELYGA